jgi:hypothetical protein
MTPLCFIMMPFGRKADAAGRVTHFDGVYRQVILPAVLGAGMEAVRADEEQLGGFIHKPMFERLLLCDYAIADLTGANSNVAYELGIRHALRPRSTIVLFSEGTSLPFDLAPLRAIAYRTNDSGEPSDPNRDASLISDRLLEAREDAGDDSPVFQLVDGMPRPTPDHSRTDLFRARTDRIKQMKNRIAEAVAEGESAVQAIAAEPSLKNLLDVDPEIVLDLYSAFAFVRAHEEMVELYSRMPPTLKRLRGVRERVTLALRRQGRFQEAKAILEDVLKEFGPSSETLGLLGSLYKDQWEIAKKGNSNQAPVFLKRAIDAYVAGFTTDWRDVFPGVNAVSLMEMLDAPDRRQAELLPVVYFAVSQRPDKDYWHWATLLELSVLNRNLHAAEEIIPELSVVGSVGWQIETTTRNVRLIRELREKRGEDVVWIINIEDQISQITTRWESGLFKLR